MNIWDDRLMELLEEKGPMSVGDLAEHRLIDTSHSTVSRRLKTLSENHLVQPVGNGVYQITEEGEGYLDEEYDALKGMWLGEEEQGVTANGSESVDEAGNSAEE